MAEIIALKVGDKLQIELPSLLGGTVPNNFQVGSLEAFWRKDRTLTEAEARAQVQRALDRGEASHFAFNLGVTLTAHRQEPVKYIDVELYDLVEIDGKTFQVTPAANHNVNIVEQQPRPAAISMIGKEKQEPRDAAEIGGGQ
ncbi:hypothetical protein EDF62_1552 [Leucobacter luti]|uniref:Uncharacterized protein n=1 Tax=Leucobacter luti TaxID=340320 RepID=A0A4R6S143_9MICO|nr:hypothetical protein [Leucobacter luti]TDP92346.1 hypothetical protein EDF62_1552 [Leucobacter luti]